VRDPGYDTEAKTYLPSYAAIAWYYNKVPHTGTMKEFVEKAREFARGPYAAALEQGDQFAAGGVRFDCAAGGRVYGAERGVCEGREAADFGDAVSEGIVSRGRPDIGAV
jgi:hypothetical protein